MLENKASRGADFEYVCLHGHSLTPVAMLRIQQLEREVQSLKTQLANRHSTACDLVRSDGTRCSCDASHNAAVYEETAAGKMEQVHQLLLQNKLFAAARLYREIHGCGLREAHAACEDLRNQRKYA